MENGVGNTANYKSSMTARKNLWQGFKNTETDERVDTKNYLLNGKEYMGINFFQ